MSDSKLNSYIALGVFLAGGMCGAAFQLASAAKAIKETDRFVTVKGLAEKEVTANLATWTIRYRATGNDLATTQADIDAQTAKIKAFLTSGGFTDAEIINPPLRVVDRQARDYVDSNVQSVARYIIEGTQLLRTDKIQQIAALSNQMSNLMKDGVSFAEENSCDIGPNFSFTKLNEIKTDMLSEATKNARAAAEQFAQDSGSKVGSIRRAYQGIFSIDARDSIPDSGGDCYANKSPDKKVRVVTTVDYFLKD